MGISRTLVDAVLGLKPRQFCGLRKAAEVFTQTFEKLLGGPERGILLLAGLLGGLLASSPILSCNCFRPHHDAGRRVFHELIEPVAARGGLEFDGREGEARLRDSFLRWRFSRL